MPEPWKTDRDLGAKGVSMAIREQFPHFDLQAIEYLGSGWDYDAYLIDRNLVVRFPRRAEVAERLEHEAAILELAGSSLSPAVAVRQITLWGQGGVHFPHRFFGHELVPGLGAADPAAPWSARLAPELGEALSHIHSISRKAATAIGAGPEEEGCDARYEEAVALVAGAEQVRELVPGPCAWVLARATLPAEYSGQPRLIHNDFSPDHVLVHRGCG